MSYEQWKEYMDQYRDELRDNDCSAYSQEAREFVIDKGIMVGGGTGADGQPNYMWEDLLTREQEAVVGKRLYDVILSDVKKLFGQA